MQDCDISSALAMEILQFCTKSSIYSWGLKWQTDSVSSQSPTYVGLVGELYNIFFVAIMVIWSHNLLVKYGHCSQLMMTSWNGNIFRVTGPLCGEFTGPGDFPTQRPVTRSFDVFFDLHPNKRLSRQPWGWWFETPSWSLWRQCNV